MRLTVRLHIYACALSLLGCRTLDRAADAPPAATSPEVTFQVRLQARGTEEWQPLTTEDVAHSGDHLALDVRSTVSVYLYVGRAVADRPIFLPWSSEPAPPTRLKPGQVQSIPSTSPGYELDSQVGEESIYLVASTATLTGDRLRALMGAAPAAELGDPRPRPPTTSNGNRPVIALPQDAAPAYHAIALAPGLFTVRFVFQHQQ